MSKNIFIFYLHIRSKLLCYGSGFHSGPRQELLPPFTKSNAANSPHHQRLVTYRHFRVRMINEDQLRLFAVDAQAHQLLHVVL